MPVIAAHFHVQEDIAALTERTRILRKEEVVRRYQEAGLCSRLEQILYEWYGLA